MTKEDYQNELDRRCNLISNAKHCYEVADQLLVEIFNSNILIPKGANRHPYADVIHAYAEGGEVEVNVNTNLQPKWNKFALGHQYRIKPSEPVYEWQYLITTMFGANENKLSKFMTDDEFIKAPRSRSEGWIKLEETKQVRQ